MAKTVKTFAIDEATKQPIMDQEIDFVINDAVEHLINQGAIADDNTGVFFQRQLEYIQSESYDVLYPDLMARECFALDTAGGEGINVITYRSYDKRGETAIIAGKATDLPRGDISGEEYSSIVKTLGNAYGYSRQEIAAAKLVGLPLEARKAEATRRSYEEKVDQLTWFGDAENKLSGLYGGPVDAPWSTCTIQAVAQGAAGTDTTWGGAHKTPDEIIRDLTDACANLYSDTLKLFRADTIFMSVEKKLYIQNTPRSIASDESILSWFLRNNSFITSANQIKDINELKNIFPDVVNGETIYDFHPDETGVQGFTVLASGAGNARIREPYPYVHTPVQMKGLEFEINCYGRFGALQLIRPAAFQHYTNI